SSNDCHFGTNKSFFVPPTMADQTSPVLLLTRAITERPLLNERERKRNFPFAGRTTPPGPPGTPSGLSFRRGGLPAGSFGPGRVAPLPPTGAGAFGFRPKAPGPPVRPEAPSFLSIPP